MPKLPLATKSECEKVRAYRRVRDRQTDSETDRQAGRQTDRCREGGRKRSMGEETDKET